MRPISFGIKAIATYRRRRCDSSRSPWAGSTSLLAAELLGVAEALLPQLRVMARDEVADARLRAELDDALGPDKVADVIDRGRRHDTRTVYATVERALEKIRTAYDD